MTVKRAFGKVMILGEYAVLYKKYAIVAAIDRYAQCNFTPNKSLDFYYTTHGFPNRSNEHPLFLSAANSLKQHGFFIRNGSYLLDSQAFFNKRTRQKLGLGSSAAAITAFLKTVLSDFGITENEAILKIALDAHKNFSKGFGSGADVAAAVLGGTFIYQLTNEINIQPIDMRKIWPNLLFISTKKSQSTKEFVKAVLELKNSHPNFLNDFCNASSDLCDQFLNADNDLGELISVMQRSFLLMVDLSKKAQVNIVNEDHFYINKVARTFHGTAKPSGAGGGDISIALIPKENHERFKAHITQQDLEVLTLNLAS